MSCGSIEAVDDLSSQDSNVRKRVGKACDRCRLKKSKCDGSKPCSRCKADNQLCLFGERKKSHDKIYPKGYVELLEHQQSLLVHALQLLYKQYWTGPSLPEFEGHPLVHDLLDRLGLLHEDVASSPISMEGFHFEENPIRMQARLTAPGIQNSQSSRPSLSPPALSPVSSQPSLFRDTFTPMQPSTPEDQQSFQSVPASSSTGFFPYSSLPVNIPTQTLAFQMNQSIDQLKLSGIPFQPSLQTSPQTTDFETMDVFSNNFPAISSYGETGEFVDEDSFGSFVDLSTT